MPQSKIILLPAPKFCGRGVEYRTLSAQEKDEARDNAAKSTALEPGEKPTSADDKRFQVAVTNEGTLKMIRRVTKRGGFTKMDEILALKPEDWTTIDSEQYAKIFGADSKDDEMLSAIFVREHQVTKDEVDAILGNALPVSADS